MTHFQVTPLPTLKMMAVNWIPRQHHFLIPSTKLVYEVPNSHFVVFYSCYTNKSQSITKPRISTFLSVRRTLNRNVETPTRTPSRNCIDSPSGNHTRNQTPQPLPRKLYHRPRLTNCRNQLAPRKGPSERMFILGRQKRVSQDCVHATLFFSRK